MMDDRMVAVCVAVRPKFVASAAKLVNVNVAVPATLSKSGPLTVLTKLASVTALVPLVVRPLAPVKLSPKSRYRVAVGSARSSSASSLSPRLLLRPRGLTVPRAFRPPNHFRHCFDAVIVHLGVDGLR